jgi:hypothetical protein
MQPIITTEQSAVLFGENLVRPCHQSDEHRRIRERGVLAFEVGLEDPRALAQAPQTCIGSFLATLVASASDKGGHPTGTTALATTLRISDTASPIPVVCPPC